LLEGFAVEDVERSPKRMMEGMVAVHVMFLHVIQDGTSLSEHRDRILELVELDSL
jgi:hypothetical protein